MTSVVRFLGRDASHQTNEQIFAILDLLKNEVKNLLKLGTVFSGIGAIEHALERMNIPYEISFACDNGNINIFEKNINKDIISVNNAFKEFENYIELIEIEKFNDFNAVDISDQLQTIQSLKDEIVTKAKEITDFILCDVELSEVMLRLNNLNLSNPNIKIPLELKEFIEHDKILDLTIFNKIVKLTKKYSDFEDSYINTKIKELKKHTIFKDYSALLTKAINEINMFYERIKTAEVHEALSKIKSFKEKKEYVDSLYKDKEKSNYVWQTYKSNYNIDDKDLHWNVSFLDGHAYENQIDLFVGGSPCQSFSMVGKRRGLEDTRGTLFYEYARLIKEIRPKVFIYENVRGLLSHDNGNTWSVMQEVFKELDYNFTFKLLNAKNYSVPQNRERIFVVGFRNDLELAKPFDFPKPLPLEKTMQDYLLENAPGKYYLNSKGVDFVTMEKNLVKSFTQIDGTIQLCQKANQQFNWHGDFIFVEENNPKINVIEELDKYFLSQKVEKYVMAGGTKNFYTKPQIDLEVARPLLTTMHKMHRAGVDNYVTTAGRIRKLTPRECLRLMGFCDSFKIVVSDTQMYKQSGNSIVVDVLIGIIREICNTLPNFVYGGPYQYKKPVYEQLKLI